MGVVNRTLRRRAAARARVQSGFVCLCWALSGILVGGASLAKSAVAQEQPNPLSQGPATNGATEPALVVTLASLDKLTNDINYITGVVGQPQAGAIFSMMTGQMTRGLDTTQPIGVIVPLVDGAPEPIALIPTSDVKQLLKSIEAQTGPADEQADGTLIIAIGPNVVYIRQMGNWAVVARNQELLDLAPANPNALFQGMGNEYDIAVRLQVQQVPPEVREMLVGQLRQGFEQAMAQQAEGDDQSARQIAEGTIKQLEMIINDTDELKFGWNIDQPQKQMFVDVSMSAVAGSPLAGIYQGQQPIPSAFSGVIRNNAAAYYHAAASVSPETIAQTRSGLDGSLAAIRNAIANAEKLNDQQRADINELVDRIVKIAVDSMAEGKVDMGALLMADDSNFQFALGSFVADGQEVARLAKDLAAKVKDEPKAPRFFFDQETYRGVVMHRVEADVPASEDEVRRIFGETLKVHVGTGPKSVYLAIGDQSESLMKELIDGGEQNGAAQPSLGQLRVQLLPILQYAQSIEANDAIAAMIDALSRAPDPGLITAIANTIPNGQSTRIVLGEGLLQAIGAAARQAQQNRQGDQF